MAEAAGEVRRGLFLADIGGPTALDGGQQGPYLPVCQLFLIGRHVAGKACGREIRAALLDEFEELSVLMLGRVPGVILERGGEGAVGVLFFPAGFPLKVGPVAFGAVLFVD